MNEMTFKAYWKVKNAKAKLANKLKEEAGMETLEAVILIVIAVIIAAIIVDVLTKGKFGSNNNGLIGYMFESIANKITSITDTTTNASNYATTKP